MNQIIAMVLAGLLSVGTAWSQDLNVGLAAYKRGDVATALNEFRPLAVSGNTEAQRVLAQFYFLGEGVPQDKAEAARWYRLAAEQGDAEAQNMLGALYYNGWGVLQDNVSGHMWSNTACALGNSVACDRRDKATSRMTPADIAEAQLRARVCRESNYKDCD